MSVVTDLNDRFENVLTVDAAPCTPRTPVEDDLLDLFDLTGTSTSKISGGRPLFTSSADQSRQSKCKFDPTSDIKFPSGQTNDPDDDANAHSTGQKKNTRFNKKPRRAPTGGPGNYTTIINSSDVKISPKTCFNFNFNQHLTTTEAFPHKPKSVKTMPSLIRSLSECTEEISQKDMFVIKHHMGSGWRDVARKLDYDDGKIEQFQENFSSQGLDEIIYQFLLDWKQMKSKDAQLGTLIKAMWSSHEYDCVKQLVKSRRNPSPN